MLANRKMALRGQISADAWKLNLLLIQFELKLEYHWTQVKNETMLIKANSANVDLI